MNTEPIFTETQAFRKWYIVLGMVIVCVMPLYGVYQQIILGKPFGDKPASDAGLIFSAVAVLLVALFILSIRLKTKITTDGIQVSFFPFISRNFKWDEIKLMYIRQYNPIMDYGGWGIRLGLFGKGTAFNVSGNIGLQLEFINEKKFLIGTQKADEMYEALKLVAPAELIKEKA